LEPPASLPREERRRRLQEKRFLSNWRLLSLSPLLSRAFRWRRSGMVDGDGDGDGDDDDDGPLAASEK
jgi:hypothetical protein